MNISRQTLFGKLNPTLFKALESATSFCKLRGNSHVELLHWLHQLLQGQDNDIVRVLRYCKVDRAALDRDLTQALMTLPGGASSISDFSTHLVDAVERAWGCTTLVFSDNRIRGGYLLAALAGTPELRRVLVGLSPQFKCVPADDPVSFIQACIDGSPESAEQAADGSSLDMDDSGSGNVPTAAKSGGLDTFCTDLTARAREGKLDPVIGRDLEIRAMIDILLRRRQNNPLLTGDAGVGKTAIVEGLAQALASGDVPPALREVRLLSLDVGGLLAGAGMKGEFESRLRGIIEEAGKSPRPVVIFVDEIHTLVGAGGTQGTGDAANLLKPALARGTLRTIGATTWSEYKKHIEKDPALTRRFQVLQVPEPDEDAAVEMVRGLVKTFRNHHRVDVREEAVRAAVRLSARYIPARQLPDKAISLLDTACARVALSQDAPPPPLAAARRKLDALRVEMELLQREQAVCPDAAHPRAERLQQLVDLREITDAEALRLDGEWQQQREAVQQLVARREALLQGMEADEPVTSDVLSELAALEGTLAELQKEQALVFPQVSAGVVAEIVADWTGIPVGRMLCDELKSVLELSAIMGRRLVGQDHALQVVARRIQSSRALLTDPGKPVGVFLLAGPSGVGKTETALALAESLYGGEQNLISVNMSEFQESHTVSTLKGAPPGYVGYGEGGVLTEAVRRRPHSVILLDEIEKAHQDVYEIFYQVFDKGWMEDGEGRYIDFKNTVILLTTNVGGDRLSALCADPEILPEPEALTEALMAELRKVFPAAFLGRLSVVPYYPLQAESLKRIVFGHLQRIRERLHLHHNLPLSFDEALVEHIIARCAVAETGARLLIGYIEQQILPEVSRAWLSGLVEGNRIASVSLELENEQPVCVCTYEEPAAS